MLVEVEGINNVGKTSLVSFLSAQGMHTRKFQRPVNPVEMMYVTHMPLAVSTLTWVIDRGHGTEWVLSKVTHRKLPYTQGQFWTLDAELAQAGVTIAYLDAPKNVVEARMAQTGREWEGPHNMLLRAWAAFLDATQCRVVRLDANQPVEELAKQFHSKVLVKEGI